MHVIRFLEYQNFIMEDIPVTVFLAILSVVGSIGNIHAFLVYYLRYKPSNHRTFVVSLAAIDLVASAISVPFELYDIRYSYTFMSAITCKSFRTLNHVVIVASGVLLGVIAVERYRKACKPLDAQLGPRGAIAACVVTVIGSIIFSIPAFFLYDAAEKVIPDPGYLNFTLHGFDCRVANKYSKSMFNKGYNGFYLFLSTVVFIICVIMYSFVGRALYKQVKFRQKTQSFKRRPSTSSVSSVNQNKIDKLYPNGSDIQDEESSSGHERKRSLFRQSSVASLGVSSPRKKQRRMDRTRKITFMFLVATAVSYIGYVPNLVILLIKGMSRKRYAAIQASLGIGTTSILLRMYFLNNVTNPIVYCFMDERFRSECKMLYRKLLFWKK